MLFFLVLGHLVIVLNALTFGSKNRALPKHGRVAILLRGQAFRQQWMNHVDARSGCHDDSIPAQLKCTDSLLKHIVTPLERNFNTVEFFVVNGVDKSACPTFRNLLMPKFAKWGGAVAKEFDSKTQADNMRATLELFKDTVGGSDYIAKWYDLIIILRHDAEWLTSITEWPTAEFDKLNLFSLCEDGFGRHQGPKENCVNDILHMMPGSLWKGFRNAVGSRLCYNPGHRRGLGHDCYRAFARQVGEDNITFVTDWRPGVIPHFGGNGILELM